MKSERDRFLKSSILADGGSPTDLTTRVRSKLKEWGVSDSGVRFLSRATTSHIDKNTRAEDILSSEEIEQLQELQKHYKTSLSWNGPRSITLIVKATRLCNLRCTYCHAWREGPDNTMSFGVAAKTFLEFLGEGGPDEIDIVWHGGEVTTLRAKHIKKLLWLQSQFAGSTQTIRNSLQTNGYKFGDDWLDLVDQYGMSVGVSIDGVRNQHDQVRRSLSGQPTFDTALTTLKRLKNREIPTGVLLVVSGEIIRYGARKLLNELHSNQINSLALLNEIPDATATDLTAWDNYVPFDDFVTYLEDIFDVWNDDYRNSIRIREIEALRNKLKNEPSGICVIEGNCMGKYLTIDPNGKISACDKYVGENGHDFGYIQKGIAEFENNIHFQSAKQEAEDDVRNMGSCEFFQVCKGGCPHDNRTTRLFTKVVGRSCCGLAPLLKRIRAAEETIDGRNKTE